MKKTVIFILVFLIALVIGAYLQNKISTKKVEMNNLNIYFVKTIEENHTKIIPVKRAVSGQTNLIKTAIAELLKGPNEEEKKQGFHTEIPENTKLINIVEGPNKVIINLSEEFEQGGGSKSMAARVVQLTNTVSYASGEKPVYLELNGKAVEYIGGEGVEVPKNHTEYNYDD
ncbi:MAG: GerMN domain-containing protein [Candidatus Gastranaerophilales bacterium]|nr:GerMN domain-containing protein [Candidatus Gastranaerophilales bacterium]